MQVLDPEQVALDRALLAERLLNARRTHVVRLVGLTFFAALFLVLGGVLSDPSWVTDSRALGAYLGLAVLCVVASRRRVGEGAADRLGTWLTFAPALIDMPFVYLVQRGQYASTPSPAAVAGFSMGLFALLLAISALSSSRWGIFASAVSAVVWEVLLQAEAGVSVGARLSAVVVLGLTAVVLAYASDRRAALLVQTSRREKLAALGQLSAGVGHDLRNPLAAISNAVFVLRRRLEKEGPISEKVEAPLGLAEREVAQCQRIVTELLDYARETKLELAPVELEPLLQECVGLLRVPPQVTVRVSIARDFPVLQGERGRLRQVFENLLQNGVEAIPEGRAGLVEVTAEALAGQVKVRVRDEGIGMDEVTRARVFEPLFTTKKQGTGLGLAIVESLVKQHGGSLSLQSTIGVGTVFTVVLPLSPPGSTGSLSG
jgi:signal transduction histidine kinase